MPTKKHLNDATNRFGLNRKKSVGDLTQLICDASPLSLEKWEEYYYKNMKSAELLGLIGEDLHRKIEETIIPELESITEDECKRYIHNLVINETFNGHRARFEILNKKINEITGKSFTFLPDHPDDWRYPTFKLDGYIVGEDEKPNIGIKICPQTMQESQDLIVKQALKEIRDTHQEFEDRGWGKEFILFYSGENPDYYIVNQEVLQEIKEI